MFVVLVLLTVMLLGGIAFARMTEVGTLASGNAAFREAAMQASEVGINTAYAAVVALTDENTSAGNWFYATRQAQDANGVPTVNFEIAPEVVVGAYRIRYVVDRMCTGALPVTDPMRQCLVKQDTSVQSRQSRSAGVEPIDPLTGRQYRITVRVTGPKDTRAWVQALVTKG